MREKKVRQKMTTSVFADPNTTTTSSPTSLQSEKNDYELGACVYDSYEDKPAGPGPIEQPTEIKSLFIVFLHAVMYDGAECIMNTVLCLDIFDACKVGSMKDLQHFLVEERVSVCNNEAVPA